MSHQPDIAATAALFGDPVRGAMLLALLDRPSLSAGQLAFAANVSPQSASFHLAKLTSAGLLRAERCGRHQIYSLSGSAVASAIESLAALSPLRKSPAPAPGVRIQSQRMQQLTAARTCYDHLAGRAAVQFHDALFETGYLKPSGDKQYVIARKGQEWLADLGLAPDAPPSRSPLVRPCLDWTERRPHLAGRLAARLLNRFLEWEWIARLPDTRAVRITDRGLREFERQYAINLRTAYDHRLHSLPDRPSQAIGL